MEKYRQGRHSYDTNNDTKLCCGALPARLRLVVRSKVTAEAGTPLGQLAADGQHFCVRQSIALCLTEEEN
jgi:hypothetical protein